MRKAAPGQGAALSVQRPRPKIGRNRSASRCGRTGLRIVLGNQLVDGEPNGQACGPFSAKI
jgi:hypothetical protein